MSQPEDHGRIHTEIDGHILKITIDNVAKYNAFDPEMMLELSEALTTLEDSPDLWVGVLCAEGPQPSVSVPRCGRRRTGLRGSRPRLAYASMVRLAVNGG